MGEHAMNFLRVPFNSNRGHSRNSSDGKSDFDMESGSSIISSPIVPDFRSNLRLSFPQHRDDDKLLDKCWDWYCRYLDASIKKDWRATLSPIIRELDPEYPKEAEVFTYQLALVYRVLETILNAIRSRNDVSLDGIIDELNLKNLLRPDANEDATVTRCLSRQMVWCLVGTATMLYDPRRNPYSRKLQLRQPASSLRSRGMRRTRDLSSSQQDIDSCRDPLHSLLGQFGDLIPRVEADNTYLSSTEHDHVNIAYINFYTLKKVAKLDIEWVNTMNLHLQLDKRKRILRLYRFPAFCRLLWSDEDDSFMQRPFADHLKTQVAEDEHTDYTIADYLREIILSYRLLFGIDRKSRHEFKAELAKWSTCSEGPSPTQSREQSRAISLTTTTAPALTNPRNASQNKILTIPINRAIRISSTDQVPDQSLQMVPQDPLLGILATTENTFSTSNPESAQATLTSLLDMLHGEEKSTLYDLEDFPFLGRRLAELQRYSLIQKPNDLKSLFWVDRRDTQNFMNSLIACALLFIGGGTIILQFWQLIFQIWGTLMAKAQLIMSQPQLGAP